MLNIPTMKIKIYSILTILLLSFCLSLNVRGQTCQVGCSNIANGTFEQKTLYGWATYDGDNYVGGFPFQYNQVSCWHEFVMSPHIWPVDSSSLLYNHFAVMALYANIEYGQISEGSEIPGIYSTNFCLDSLSQYKVRFNWAVFNCDSITNFQGNLAFCFTNDTLFSLSDTNSSDIIISFGGVDPELGILYDNYQNPPMFYSANWHQSQTLKPFLYENQERFIVTNYIDTLPDGIYKALIFIDNIEFIPYIEFKIDTICAETSHYKIYPINLNPKYQIQFESSWSSNLTNFTAVNDTCEFDLITYSPGTLSDIKISYLIQDTACNLSSCITSDTLFTSLYPYVPPQVTFNIVEDITCFPFCDGKIVASLVGGAGGGTYNWSNGLTDSLNTNACLGFNSVTLFDQFGCQKTDSVELQELPFSAEIVTYSESVCGVCDAVIGVNFISGEGPYTYAWDNQLTSNINNQACVGLNTVIITDNDGCTFEESIQVFDSIQPSFSNVIVEGCVCDSNSHAFAYIPENNISNGVPPYQFYWFTNPYQAQDTAFFNTPGIYEVEMTSNGCVFNKSFNISCYQITPLKVYKATCPNVCDGSISGWSIESNCVSPIDYNNMTYLWSFGDTMYNSQPINNLCAGTYFVTIIDANGYFGIDTLIIENSNIPYLSISTNLPSCSNICDGEIEATLSNFPNYPITFHIYQSAISQTVVCNIAPNAMFNNLCKDSFYITATDTNGCFTEYQGYLISEPFYNLDSMLTNNCESNDSIAINLTTFGLYGPFSYQWNSGEVTQDIIALAPGAYYVTTTDVNNCSVVDTFSLSNNQIYINIDILEQTCPGIANGRIDLYLNGGQPPYSYHWNTGESTPGLQNLGIGHFFVTITDSYGCQIDTQVYLSDSHYLQTDYNIFPMTCPDTVGIVYLGSIDLNISGGFKPYIVNWSNSCTTISIDSLQAGYYQVTVTDSIGCVNTQQVYVPGDGIQIELLDIGNGCDSIPTGFITPIIYGGIPPYNYLWNNMSTSDTLNNLIDMMYYSVTISDNYGCSGSDSIKLMSEQHVKFIEGWSIWSTYIDLSSYNIKSFFDSLNFSNNIVEMKNSTGEVYIPQYNVNTIGTFNNNEAYQIKTPVDGPDTLTINGRMICPLEVDFNKTGWRLIPYLRKTPINVKTELMNQIPNLSNYVDIVKNGIGANYLPFYNLNLIGDFIPGEGYYFHFIDSVSWHYSSNNDFLGTKEEDFCVQMIKTLNNADIITDESMTIGIPLECWDIIPTVGDVIIVRGEYSQIVGRTIFCGQFTPITIYGDDSFTEGIIEGLKDGESFSIEIQNINTNKIIQNVISLKEWEKGDGFYRKDKISILKKENRNLESKHQEYNASIFPNPNRGAFTINVLSELNSDIDIKIFDAIGKMLYNEQRNLNEGENSFNIELKNVEPGIYYCKFDLGIKYLKFVVL